MSSSSERGFPVHAWFAVVVGGFSHFGIRRILTSMLRIWRKYDAAVILGIDVLCSINPLQSSCIPHSQYKIAGWVLKRAIACDRVATLFFERASDCTQILCFCEFSTYFCTPRFWVCPDRVELLPDLKGVHRVHPQLRIRSPRVLFSVIVRPRVAMSVHVLQFTQNELEHIQSSLLLRSRMQDGLVCA